jgi:arginine decarboxylase
MYHKSLPVLETVSVRNRLIGNRIPRDYFITSGTGESEISQVNAFDKALRAGGISNINIIIYSSILPKTATKVEKQPLVHGSVVECIMARCDGEAGQRLTAGLGLGWLYKKINNEKIGGIVVEYHGNLTEEATHAELGKRLHEMLEDRCQEGTEFELRNIEIDVSTFEPKKRYGSTMVALCFINYEYPEIAAMNSNKSKAKHILQTPQTIELLK